MSGYMRNYSPQRVFNTLSLTNGFGKLIWPDYSDSDLIEIKNCRMILPDGIEDFHPGDLLQGELLNLTCLNQIFISSEILQAKNVQLFLLFNLIVFCNVGVPP